MMRALRDSNVTKFVNADVGIFLGLVSDIFPKMGDAVKQADATMTAAVTHVLKSGLMRSEKGVVLQSEEVFIAKTVDLAELLGIRHCVFALGAAGSAKSCCWKTLQAAQTYLNIGNGPSLVSTLNPKAVTSDDLYGWVHPATKEPYDGISTPSRGARPACLPTRTCVLIQVPTGTGARSRQDHAGLQERHRRAGEGAQMGNP